MTVLTGPTKIRNARLISRGREAVASGEIQRVREALRLSRLEIAALIGVPGSNVAHWETAKNVPQARHAILIAIALGKLRHLVRDAESSASADMPRELAR